eukprot:CAMPEP_0185023348 /NCGR_PEP_ID=MMETSP1103-20130426/6027_1 /TAXON_ID=36769 /ORGANISM="Paraphysomonas bandaiensis, Strain Caron Lab Isolate" /LENGTH=898 /DNA_ID=CAMNT_0027555905 /DNA_START=817 /DNA_END=3513 /DNA_ORIENTATION=+
MNWHEDISQIPPSALGCHAPEPVDLQVTSHCDTPLELYVDTALGPYGSTCVDVSASSTLHTVNATLYYTEVHSALAADMELTIRSKFFPKSVVIGGWDYDDRVDELEWPNSWNSINPGVFRAAVDVSSYALGGNGYYEVCLMNKYENSEGATYKGTIELIGLITECGVTYAPTVTPAISSTAGCDETIEVDFDVTLTAKQTQCSPTFTGVGSLFAVNIALDFVSSGSDFLEYASDLELKIIKLSTSERLVIGYDARDIKIHDDDDGKDNDGGSVIHSISMEKDGVMVDLMSASLWLSPSSALTAPMVVNEESCDGELCSMFTSDGTFIGRGSAGSSQYYPRLVEGPLHAPIHISAAFLKDYSCDDQFIFLSTSPVGDTFAFSTHENTISFTWDCEHKMLYGPSARNGIYCGANGYYELEFGINEYGIAYFYDNICSNVTVNVSDLSGPFYLFMGSDNDKYSVVDDDDIGNGGIDTDDNALNSYDYEWPHSWTTSDNGEYSASLLVKEESYSSGTDEYQVCFSNTWDDAKHAGYKGKVKLIGITPCIGSSPSPTPGVCTPGNRAYCNNNGACAPGGDGCDCDDPLHYWASDKCSTWHRGRLLHDESDFCYPNTIDYYCSWLGRCSADGSTCECFDSDHRSSSDRCDSWSPEPVAPEATPDLTCVPNDRYYCNNRGSCSLAGTGCVCDDPGHYWPSERCSTFHWGGELADDQCCTPGESDYYCNWMGTCDEEGMMCICFDPEHRLSSERCQFYHKSISNSTVSSTISSSCPEQVTVPEEESSAHGDSSSTSGVITGWVAGTVVGAVLLGVMVVAIVAARHRRKQSDDADNADNLKSITALADTRITQFEVVNPGPTTEDLQLNRGSRVSLRARLSEALTGYGEVDDSDAIVENSDVTASL